jgi:hypothetical protein
MATTTNYGWTTPDDTALVKDGASAIRTLGSSVDTTTKALNPETTLGDLAYRSSTANVKTRLGLGTAGQFLAVNSGATAPEWQTLNAGGMTLISTTTLTGSSVTISSIPGTYNNLQLIIKNYQPASDRYIKLRMNSDSTANRHVGNSGAFDSTSFYVAANQDSTTSQSLSIIDIHNYANATTWKFMRAFGVNNDTATPANANIENNYGAYNQTGAITSLQLFPDAGNFTSGTVLLYGVK